MEPDGGEGVLLERLERVVRREGHTLDIGLRCDGRGQVVAEGEHGRARGVNTAVRR